MNRRIIRLALPFFIVAATTTVANTANAAREVFIMVCEEKENGLIAQIKSRSTDKAPKESEINGRDCSKAIKMVISHDTKFDLVGSPISVEGVHRAIYYHFTTKR